MKKIKRTIKAISLILSVAMVAGLATSCGDTTKDTDKQGRTVVSVGSWPAKSGSLLDSYERQKKEFEEANTDAVIIPDTWVFDVRTFYPKAEAGMLPNVYVSHFTELPQIIDAGYSADITDVLKKHNYDGKFSDRIMSIIAKDGKQFALPYGTYVLGLAYNTDMFEKAGLMESDGTPKQPKTWDEAAQFAVKIKEATGKPGIVFPTSSNSGGWIFTSLAWSYGARFMEKDTDGNWKATFNSDECVAALEYIKDLKWKYDVLPANTLIDNDEYHKTFATGGAGMYIAAGDFTRNLTAYNMLPEQIGIMGIPAGPARRVTLLGGNVFAFSNNCTEKQIDVGLRWLELRGFGHELTDSAKKSMEEKIQISLGNKELVGIKSMSVWNENAEVLEYQNELIDKYANANPNHVRLYNEFVLDNSIEIQSEEPVCTQDLYGVLDNCIQEVLNNKDVDCRTVLEKAKDDFQANYLNNIDY